MTTLELHQKSALAQPPQVQGFGLLPCATITMSTSADVTVTGQVNATDHVDLESTLASIVLSGSLRARNQTSFA